MLADPAATAVLALTADALVVAQAATATILAPAPGAPMQTYAPASALLKLADVLLPTVLAEASAPADSTPASLLPVDGRHRTGVLDDAVRVIGGKGVLAHPMKTRRPDLRGPGALSLPKL